MNFMKINLVFVAMLTSPTWTRRRLARRIPYLRLCPVVTRDEWICTGVVDVAVVVGEG